MADDILQENIDTQGYARLPPVKFTEKRIADFLELRDTAPTMTPGRLAHRFEEAVTMADFPILTQYVTQREVVARYRTTVPDWLPMVKIDYHNSFTRAEELWVTGIHDILPEQAEGQERHEVYQSELKFYKRLRKFGAKYKVTFEAQVNDILGALRDIPQQFADAARATEAYLMASALVTSSGLSTLFSDTARAPAYDENGTLVTDARNPTVDNLLDASHDALSMEHLKLAIKQMAGMTDAKGRKMGLRARYLIIPPALELDAQEILGATTVAYAATAASPVPLTTVNAVAKYGLQVIVNEFLPVVNTAATGDTQWFLATAPAQGTAFRVSYLQGMAEPQVFMKASNKVSTGGGSLGIGAGDFDTDDMQYAIRHIVAVNTGDPRFVLGALGDTA